MKAGNLLNGRSIGNVEEKTLINASWDFLRKNLIEIEMYVNCVDLLTGLCGVYNIHGTHDSSDETMSIMT